MEMRAMEEWTFSFLAMAVGFVVVVYLYEPYWKVRHVPGPVPLPLVGHLHLLAKHGPGVFAALAKKHGPVFRFHVGRQPLIIVADAELCKEVGIKKFKSIPNRSLPSPIANSPIHLKGLFATRDSRWSAMRNIIVSIYQPSHLAGLIPAMESCIQRAATNLDDGEEVVFSDLAVSLATDVIGQAAFGADFGLSRKLAAPGDDTEGVDGGGAAAKASSEFIDMHIHSTTSLKMDLSGSLSTIVGTFVPFLQKPLRQALLRVPGSADREITRVNGELRRMMDGIVAARVAARERAPASQPHKDFLSVLLAAREGDASTRELLSPDYLSALTYEHLLAGSATTAFTLSSVVYLVAEHPEVVKESMRLFMVSPLVARETSERVEIGGFVLPKGAWVWMAPGVLAKDPINFPDPELFRPERFDPAGDEHKRRHPYAFIPFGIGPRVCIGQKFAIQEIKLAVIHFYQRYVFRHSPSMESPLEFQFGIVVNFKHGVKLQVIKRHKNY
ncbi:hypothetical protein C2845_PM08G23040 [Panicum miliaceum]|uniref:Cytochrome P450 711A1 n=1 Tax=Panicum miliaceum TaxID=4540 RepID=A0A3L6QZF4_PANMI|nr:hypothetical protein C2845_PM08G23040 [Panicum miliaceum]